MVKDCYYPLFAAQLSYGRGNMNSRRSVSWRFGFTSQSSMGINGLCNQTCQAKPPEPPSTQVHGMVSPCITNAYSWCWPCNKWLGIQRWLWRVWLHDDTMRMHSTKKDGYTDNCFKLFLLIGPYVSICSYSLFWKCHGMSGFTGIGWFVQPKVNGQHLRWRSTAAQQHGMVAQLCIWS